MYTFTCQKTLLHTLLLLVFKSSEAFNVSLSELHFVDFLHIN